ncbi:MAG TPA: hypothetical protein VGB51_09210 [Actinomycetota bacterium]
MPVRSVRLGVHLAAVAVLVSLVTPGFVQGATPTSIGSLAATVSGTQVAVTGAASFGGQDPVTVTVDPVGDAPGAPDLGDETGVDLVAARLYQPNANVPELVVEWELTGLPPSGGVPEGTRYSLPFKVGTKEFQVQAKFSNLASITTSDDPPGHVTHVGATFQLRGNCTTSWNGSGVAYCYHLAWLTGEFVPAQKVVRVRLPLGSSAAPDIAPGASLVRNTSTNANLNAVLAGYQAVVALSPTTNDEASFGPEEEETYTFVVPKKTVALGIAPAGTPVGSVTFGTNAAVAADSSFSGSVSTAGLVPGSYDVWAKACFAGNCAARSATITI